MSTHNIGFYEDLTKIIFEISSNIIKYAPYFFCCIIIMTWQKFKRNSNYEFQKCSHSYKNSHREKICLRGFRQGTTLNCSATDLSESSSRKHLRTKVTPDST